ncbi:hypothetical protein [Hafnia alvei]|uniref:hypothetical protein n=1 Tax=Hafnia alvei TaxID=569 RepID=UPI0024A91E43|nr:hypothetical protein [Hafnia alvei]
MNKLSVIFNQQFELHKNELTARMIKVLDCGYENAEIVNEIKEKVDSIHENGRYNKKILIVS